MDNIFKYGSMFAILAIVLLTISTSACQSVPIVAPTPIARLATAPPAHTPTITPTPALASSNVSGVRVAIVPVAPASPLAAKDFATLNVSLAEKIAVMNLAQFKFIRDLRASAFNGRLPGRAAPLFQKGTALTDQDLKDLAGNAMDVAILAELSGKQNNGNAPATQSADAFYAVARNAFALALDAQNVRAALQSGLIPGGQAIDIIASYGVDLWNSSVTDGNSIGNPFAAQTKRSTEPSTFLNLGAASQVQAQANAGNSSIWIAQSSTQNTRTLNVPAAQSPVSNPFDPNVLKLLTTAAGQSDGNKAQQVAAANLQRLGAKSTSSDPAQPAQLQVPTNPVAVSGNDQIKTGNLPSFKSGKATIVSKNSASDDNAFLNSFGLDGDQPPTDQGKTPVQDAPARVSLNLTNIVITNVNKRAPGSGSFEADVNFTFVVNWTTTLAAPNLIINCNSGLINTVAQTSGSLNLKANSLMILYPGTIDVYCYATSANGQTLGSTIVHVLVGDAADATKRALQVETDSANLNATLTAEARTTQSAEQTQAAATLRAQQTRAVATAQAVGTISALETEVAAAKTAEFRLTASAFATKQAQPPPATLTPRPTPTFTPRVVDQLIHPGNVDVVTTKVVLQRGRLYRFTFTGRVNVINPPRSLTAGQLPDRVNGAAVPPSGIIVVQGTGGVATITCGHEVPDPKNPGAYSITVEDLGPM